MDQTWTARPWWAGAGVQEVSVLLASGFKSAEGGRSWEKSTWIPAFELHEVDRRLPGFTGISCLAHKHRYELAR